MDAASIIFQLHGKCLRLLCDDLHSHFDGISSAARAAHRQNRITSSLKRKIIELDVAYHITRHVSSPSAEKFYATLQAELKEEDDNPPVKTQTTQNDVSALPCPSVKEHTTTQQKLRFTPEAEIINIPEEQLPEPCEDTHTSASQGHVQDMHTMDVADDKSILSDDAMRKTVADEFMHEAKQVMEQYVKAHLNNMWPTISTWPQITNIPEEGVPVIEEMIVDSSVNHYPKLLSSSQQEEMKVFIRILVRSTLLRWSQELNKT